MFKQGKKHIANFMIGFKALAMKAKTNNIHTIFLLKKNIRTNIIKIILRYLPMAVPEILRKQKMAIISVGQGYKSTESQQNYRIETEMTYGGRKISINIEKVKDNFDKDGRLKYFNCNTYGHIAKEY